MLYDRDYRILTDYEIKQMEKAEAILKRNGKKVYLKDLFRYHKALPVAAAHYKTIFPNNYLNTDELENAQRLLSIKSDFEAILNNDTSEREILNFIEKERAYFLIGTILKGYYNFGHHEAFAFKEFPLPPNYVADYLLVGKNSHGYSFVFVELENANGSITTKEGDFGIAIRKGLQQVNEWEVWTEANYSHLKLVFDKYKRDTETLPEEFYTLDKSRIHFVVVAGRRNDFTKKTQQLARRLKKHNDVLLLHYDHLLDGVDMFLHSANY